MLDLIYGTTHWWKKKKQWKGALLVQLFIFPCVVVERAVFLREESWDLWLNTHTALLGAHVSFWRIYQPDFWRIYLNLISNITSLTSWQELFTLDTVPLWLCRHQPLFTFSLSPTTKYTKKKKQTNTHKNSWLSHVLPSHSCWQSWACVYQYSQFLVGFSSSPGVSIIETLQNIPPKTSKMYLGAE